MKETNKIVEEIRKIIKNKNLDAFIINGTDPHKSEYVCEHWQSRKFVSSFSGSAGTIVITQDKAIIWVDSRYFIQCEQQIKDSCFEMMRLDGPESSKPSDFMLNLPNKKVGISAETLMLSESRKYKEIGIDIVACEDILDSIWKDRPPVPSTEIYTLKQEYCGVESQKKVNAIRKLGEKNNEKYFIISSLDDIAWILNMRGNDIEHCPVFVSYLIISPDSVYLFTTDRKITGISDNIKILPYNSVFDFIKNISKKGEKIRINPEKTNMKIFDALKGAQISEGYDYSELQKSCKNNQEISGMIKAHIIDGVALVNFISLIKKSSNITELSASEILEKIKKENQDYIGPSFSTITGFSHHGAIVHYSADDKSDIPIEGNGLLVLDCGSQYQFGTTDVTRTILFGDPSQQQKRDYTLVLKGHLALSRQIFPEGTTGADLNILAHQFLWNNGMDYFHGTGHGVGCFLNVHESPVKIASSGHTVLKNGMITSDEPGLYREGQHGIRIENLVVIQEAFENEFGKFLHFKTLTCCPYERKLIVKDMLTEEEIKQINDYNSWVFETLKDIVKPESLLFLKEETAEL